MVFAMRPGILTRVMSRLGLVRSKRRNTSTQEAMSATKRTAGPPHAGPHEMFRMIRYFSVASFVCIVIAATALTAFFRYVAIREIVEFGESSGVALAQAALTAVRDDLLEYLAKTDKTAPGSLADVPVSPALAHEIDDLMRVKSVARLKIYNREGWVVFATRESAIGTDQEDNAGVIAALAGRVTSSLVYRDAFNAFDHETEEDNLIQTYVPIAADKGTPVYGAFEVYMDVNPMVQDTERAQWQIISGAAVIMALLYLALLAVVRYAERIIRRQHDEIRERTVTLERLSAHMLENQEDEKRRIAFDLHEGVAQTLTAVKMNVETAARQLSANDGGNARSLQPMVQAVKEAIVEVRGVAMNLRPSSLDDLGLVVTIQWFCREFSKLHPDIEAGSNILVSEEEVPPPLKIIIYRVLEEACRAIADDPATTRMQVTLGAEGETIALTIEFDGGSETAGDEGAYSDLAAPRERTVLSGGSFQVSTDASAVRKVRATWLR